jgi:hypothetical protein
MATGRVRTATPEQWSWSSCSSRSSPSAYRFHDLAAHRSRSRLVRTTCASWTWTTCEAAFFHQPFLFDVEIQRRAPRTHLAPRCGRSTGTGSCRDTIRARQPSRSAARGRTAWHRHRRAHSLSDSVTQNPHASGDHHRTPGRAHAPCLRARPREAVGVAGARCPPVRSAEEHRVGRARGPCLRAAPPLTVCSSPRCARMTARAPPPH